MTAPTGTVRVVGALLVLSWAGAGIAAAGPPADKDGSVFLKNYCVRCHGPEKGKAGLRLHTLTEDVSTDAEAEHWTRILGVLQKGQMPPEEMQQPKPAERAAMMQSIRSRLRAFEQRRGVRPVGFPRRAG